MAMEIYCPPIEVVGYQPTRNFIEWSSQNNGDTLIMSNKVFFLQINLVCDKHAGKQMFGCNSCLIVLLKIMQICTDRSCSL